MAQNPSVWGTEVCKAFGLDPKRVTRIELVLDASGPATVIIHMYPDKNDAVVDALRHAGKEVEHIKFIDNAPPRKFDTIGDLPGAGAYAL